MYVTCDLLTMTIGMKRTIGLMEFALKMMTFDARPMKR
jgi:hypothetical protein